MFYFTCHCYEMCDCQRMVDVKNSVIEACLREKEDGCESVKMVLGEGVKER